MEKTERFTGNEYGQAREAYEAIMGKRAGILTFQAYRGCADMTPKELYFTFREEAARRMRILTSPNAKALVMAYWAQREGREDEEG